MIDINDREQLRPLVERIESPVTAAALAAEALRWVMHRIARLRDVGDLYWLVGQQVAILERLPQALEAEGRWLLRHQDEIAIGGSPSSGPTAAERVDAARTALLLAQQEIEACTHRMRRAHGLLSPLYGPASAEEEVRSSGR